MDTVKRIGRNIFFQGISEVVTRAVQIFILIYIARFFREVEFGKFNFAIAFAAISLIFIDLGMQPLLVKEISRKKELASKYISHALIIKSALSVAGYFAVVLIMNAMNYQKDVRLIVYVMIVSTIFKSLSDILGTVFLAYEQMHWDAVLKILKAVILLVSVSFALYFSLPIIYVAVAYAVTDIVVFAASVGIIFTKLINFAARLQKDLVKYLTIESLPYALTVLFYSIYFYIDSVMLSKMRGLAEVGIYSAAYNITIALVSIPHIYVQSIFPTLSRFFVKSKSSIEVTYNKSLKYLSILAIPITTILFFLSDNIVHFLYGQGFHNSSMVLKIIAITIFFRFVTFVNGIVIISIDKQKQRLYYQGITALINIVLNLILIPLYGYVGAAIATVATELFLFITYFIPVSEYFKTISNSYVLLKPILVAALSSSVFYIKAGTYLQMILFLLAYGTGLLIIRVFDKEDWNIMKRLSKFYKN